MCRRSRQAEGFTLTELLVVLVVIGIVGALAIPVFSSSLQSKKLEVAAQEVASAMRFAVSEARRSGGYVMVDGKTIGHLKVYYSNASGGVGAAVSDPLTKRALDLDVSGSSSSAGVTVTPKFLGSSGVRDVLLISPDAQPQFWALKGYGGGSNDGPLQAGSGVLLTLGTQSVTVAINEVTGRVTLP